MLISADDIGYPSPLSVAWGGTRMGRFHGTAEAAEFVRSIDFPTQMRPGSN